MKLNFNIKLLSIIFTSFAAISFFYGFYIDEISMGAGGYNGDFVFVTKSIDLFYNNSIKDSILLFSETSNRPPLIYILHKLFNPFFVDELNFRRSVFTLSLFIPILFFLCLKERFKNSENNLLALFASILFFNPFFRTSSYWGLEENYAIISTLAAFIFLLRFANHSRDNFWNISINIFLITFFSSLSIYFDQKFLIIPLICFFNIILSNQKNIYKIFCLIFYTIFAIPYIYLIYLWGGIFPTNIYNIGSQFFFHHIGYAITIIAFIFFPFIFLKTNKIGDQISEFLSKKQFLLLLLIVILIYLIVLFFFL